MKFTAEYYEEMAEWAAHLADPVRFADPAPAKAWPGDTAADMLRQAAALLREQAKGAQGDAVDRVEAHKSYGAIDRWLRNNMDDEEYAEYSAELDRVFAYTAPRAAVPDGYSCAKETPDGAHTACAHWCGDPEKCLSTTTYMRVGEVIMDSGEFGDIQIIRWREGFAPRVGMAIYADPSDGGEQGEQHE